MSVKKVDTTKIKEALDIPDYHKAIIELLEKILETLGGAP